MLAYTITVFLSAFLLFQIELIIGKELLPWFGGTPSVWTTCLMFFQMVLLAGYTYSHYLFDRLRSRFQRLLHFSLIGGSLLVLLVLAFQWPSPITPDPSWKPEGSAEPIGRLLILLATCIGLPFFVLSTTGPLLQAWFATAHPDKSPYRLYALSNVGSLLGLISYPLIVEPILTIHAQSIVWTIGYVFFCVGVMVCAARVEEGNSPVVHERAYKGSAPAKPAPGLGVMILWTSLAAVASALMLSTTNHMCQDTAIIPMLWVLPLSIYLLTFVLCFEYEGFY